MSDETNPLGLHFEHEWQREAWEAEMADRRERKRQQRISEVEEASGNVAEMLSAVKPTLVPDVPFACLAPRMPMPPGDPAEHCDRGWHYRWSKKSNSPVAIERCAEVRRQEILRLLERERERLAGELAVIEKLGPVGFFGFDQERCDGAKSAWQAAWDFSQGRPPTRNAFLAGTTGLGKTRLMLASHFALLGAGVRSVYVTSPELRQAFEDQRAFDEELREQGATLAERLVRTQAVHLDDLGNVDDDERKRGLFAEGLKKILDRSKAAWFAATNLTWDEAMRHPDVGAKVLSRLVNGAVVVKLSGQDFRVQHAERRV